MESEVWSFEIKTKHVRAKEDFQAAMDRIQARLIQCHLPAMDDQTRARAERTLCWLNGGMTAEQALRPGMAL